MKLIFCLQIKEQFLKGKKWDFDTFNESCKILKDEVGLSGDPPGFIFFFIKKIIIKND